VERNKNWQEEKASWRSVKKTHTSCTVFSVSMLRTHTYILSEFLASAGEFWKNNFIQASNRNIFLNAGHWNGNLDATTKWLDPNPDHVNPLTLQELPEDGAPVLSMEDPELEVGPGPISGGIWRY
jgi:hypothetical protein